MSLVLLQVKVISHETRSTWTRFEVLEMACLGIGSIGIGYG